MSKLTLSAANAAQSYLALSALLKVAGIPASLRYAFAPLVRSLEGPYKDLTEGEMLLVDRYAEKDEAGEIKPRLERKMLPDGTTQEVPVPNGFLVPQEKVQAYLSERAELLSQECVIEYLPIDLSRYLDRLDEGGVAIPEGTFEILWPFFLTH